MKGLDVPVILVALLAGALGLAVSMGFPSAEGVFIKTPYAEYRYPIDRDRTVTVKGLLGPYVIEIKDRKVRAVESACPEKICIQRGWVYRSGDSIVCIPNNIIVRLENGSQDIDAITE